MTRRAMLALDASAPNDVPPFAARVIDGFAIRASHMLEGSAELELIGRGEGRHRGRRPPPRHRHAGVDRRPRARPRRRDVSQEMTTSDGARVSIADQVRIGWLPWRSPGSGPCLPAGRRRDVIRDVPQITDAKDRPGAERDLEAVA